MKFTKIQGAGNDFIIIDNRSGEISRDSYPALAKSLCVRRLSIGADGLMMVERPEAGGDLQMVFYNNDGSEGEMCGNGARCAARYAFEHGLVRDDQDIRFLATAGEIRGRRITEDLYEVRLNNPSVVDRHRLAVTPDETVPCCYVELGSPGIPHAVVRVGPEAFEDLDALRERGRALRYSASFPKGANVSFVCQTGEGCVRAITFERGVEDFTLACGTGAGAIAVSMNESLQVDMPGGTLSIRLVKDGGMVKELYLTGPTEISQ